MTAVPNFWGYTHAAELRFQRCLRGYCCMSPACRRHDECAPHRAGRLCGRCVAGYSEALFSPRCLPHAECDDTWLWPLVVGSGVLYFLALLYETVLRELLTSHVISCRRLLCSRLGRAKPRSAASAPSTSTAAAPAFAAAAASVVTAAETRPTSSADVTAAETRRTSPADVTAAETRVMSPADVTNDESTRDSNSGDALMIILVYYFQDVKLLHYKMENTFDWIEHDLLLASAPSGILGLRQKWMYYMHCICLLAGLTPTTRLLLIASFVPYVWLHFALAYCVYQAYAWRRRRAHPTGDGRSPADTCPCQLAMGLMLSLLFTYQKLATTSFTLLNSVQIGNESVLFFDGTLLGFCLQHCAVMAYVTCCVLPFPLALLLGAGLLHLQSGFISLTHFFCACFLPLPFVVHWAAVRLRLCGERQRVAPRRPLSAESRAVLRVVQVPFRTTASAGGGAWPPACGAGVVLAGRLVLMLFSSFVINPLVRMICMLSYCFVILLNHMHVLPYKEARVNAAASVSASALLVVGGINLVRAGFEAAEYVPLGPNRIIMQVLDEVDDVLMFWLPVSVVSVTLAGLGTVLAFVAVKATCVWWGGSDTMVSNGLASDFTALNGLDSETTVSNRLVVVFLFTRLRMCRCRSLQNTLSSAYR